MMYEWKSGSGRAHRCEFGATVSAAIQDAAESDARAYGITVDQALSIILNGMCAADEAITSLVKNS